MKIFQNRRLIIATKHKKEHVLAPLLEKELGVICIVDETFDTDAFGTFTGEVERQKDPISTAREKCLKAMQANKCDLGVASEGSFGAHPSLFFVPADDEFLIFIDVKNNLEIIARELSTATNYNSTFITTQEELLDFAQAVGFPEHALILRKSKQDFNAVFKGIQDPNTLVAIFKKLRSINETVYVETDMRALYNPTRMTVIQKAGEKLIAYLMATCPRCNTPGFKIMETKTGLPCSRCGLPTQSILSATKACKNCHYQEEERFPQKKSTEDPMYCNYCNP